MTKRNNSAVVLLVALLGILPAAGAENYPTKPIRLVVGFAPGGTADIIARLIGQGLSENLGQQIVVDNRAGAGSRIGSEIVAKATPDGYTLIMISSSHAINAGFSKKLPYDPVRDYAAIVLVASAPLVAIVNTSLPVRSVRDLIELARARPGQLNFGSSGTGGSSHLAGELLKSMANINLTHVPYKGASLALADLIGGQVQVLIPTLPTALTQIKAGRVRAIAVTSRKRSAIAPDIPTFAESGVPGYDAINWYGILAPAATPKQIVSKLNAEVLKLLKTPEMTRAINRRGAEPLGSAPQEFQRYLSSEIVKWRKVIRDAGIGSGR